MLVVRALAEAVGQTSEHVRKLVARSGDVGSMTETLIPRRAGRLTIAKVFNELNAIVHSRGSGAQQTKVTRLAALLGRASALEAKYIVRAALGTHRIGVGELTFLAALGRAFGGKGNGKAALDNAYNVLSDLGEVAYRTARHGLASLKRVKPVPGIPVRMMLATRVEDLDEVPLHIPGEMFVEYKYDGERVQFHRNARGELRALSSARTGLVLLCPVSWIPTAVDSHGSRSDVLQSSRTIKRPDVSLQGTSSLTLA